MGIWVCCLVLVWVNGGFGETEGDKTLSPYFFIENGDPSVDRFPLKETHVKVEISGVLADVVVTQQYQNSGTRPINAKYIFPASTRAAVHGMKMVIGENVITAKVMERQSAQEKFDQAKQEGKSASLLKQQRPNVFSMDVANIMPNESIDIELRYTELIVPTDGTYEFVYPTVVGPRYSSQPESTAKETDLWIQNPYLKEGTPDPTRFNINVHVSSGIPIKEISCQTHKTDIIWENDKRAGILLSKSDTCSGNRDFILDYRLAGKKIESGLMLYEGEEENFFLLMVEPPERVLPPDIPPREYIFVVDVSGSMNGFPLNTAKKLLQSLIGNLKPTDKFNVVLFAGASKVMASASVLGTSENIRQALRVIDREKGGGGTELYAALKKSMALPRDEGTARTVLIVTDGYIGAERDVFEMIGCNLNHTNVFAFGIGSSVNRYLIEGMAKAGMGEPFVVTRPEEAEAASIRFRNYVASPVLTHIQVSYSGFETYDIEPVSIPDLFAKRPVIVFGKWRGRTQGMVELSGIGGTGEYLQNFDVGEVVSVKTNRPIRYLWARSRISRLSDFSLNAPNDENRAEMTNLGLTYNLLTDYTSFIAVHEVIRNHEGPGEDVKQPLPLPKNVSNLAVGVSCKSVPEPELGLLTVMVLVIIIMAGYRKRFFIRGNDRTYPGRY